MYGGGAVGAAAEAGDARQGHGRENSAQTVRAVAQGPTERTAPTPTRAPPTVARCCRRGRGRGGPILLNLHRFVPQYCSTCIVLSLVPPCQPRGYLENV